MCCVNRFVQIVADWRTNPAHLVLSWSLRKFWESTTFSIQISSAKHLLSKHHGNEYTYHFICSSLRLHGFICMKQPRDIKVGIMELILKEDTTISCSMWAQQDLGWWNRFQLGVSIAMLWLMLLKACLESHSVKGNCPFVLLRLIRIAALFLQAMI